VVGSGVGASGTVVGFVTEMVLGAGSINGAGSFLSGMVIDWRIAVAVGMGKGVGKGFVVNCTLALAVCPELSSVALIVCVEFGFQSGGIEIVVSNVPFLLMIVLCNIASFNVCCVSGPACKSLSIVNGDVPM
jgi:hypothetical protein